MYVSSSMNIELNDTLILFNELTQIERALFKVVGMYCFTCKPIVEKQSEDENGIKKIGVDYRTDSVVVEYDSALIKNK